MNIEEYLDELIANGLERNHWFMTKQTMSDYYFPYYVGYVVDTYPDKHKQGQNFARYYMECFKGNPETKELYPKQWESENTYRNAIVAEFLGIIDRTTSRYDQASATAAAKAATAQTSKTATKAAKAGAASAAPSTNQRKEKQAGQSAAT